MKHLMATSGCDPQAPEPRISSLTARCPGKLYRHKSCYQLITDHPALIQAGESRCLDFQFSFSSPAVKGCVGGGRGGTETEKDTSVVGCVGDVSPLYMINQERVPEGEVIKQNNSGKNSG